MKQEASQPELGDTLEKRKAIPPEAKRLAVCVGLVLAVVLIFVALDIRCALSRWVNWGMLEAVGTVSAVLAAILLAWWEGTRNTRRQEQERRMVRRLLEQEIRQNYEEVDAAATWLAQALGQVEQLKLQGRPDDLWRTATYDAPPQPPTMAIHAATRRQLTDQLALYCRSVTVEEAAEIETFYEYLHDLDDELRGYSSWPAGEALITVPEVERKLLGLSYRLDQMGLQRRGIELVKELFAS